MAMHTFEVEFNDKGEAILTKGDGSKWKVTDPAKLAKLMEQLANKMGPVIEKHAAHSHIHLTDKGFVQEEHEHE